MSVACWMELYITAVYYNNSNVIFSEKKTFKNCFLLLITIKMNSFNDKGDIILLSL